MEKRIAERSLCSLVGERGIKTSSDFVDFFTALMVDVAQGNVDAQDATAICKAGDKALRIVEIELQYGAGQPIQISNRKALGTPSSAAARPVSSDDPKVVQ